MQVQLAHVAAGPFEPLQPLAASLAAVAYHHRARTLRRQGRPVAFWRELSFYAGLVLIVGTLALIIVGLLAVVALVLLFSSRD